MEKTALTGGLVNYYLVKVDHPQRTEQPAYQAECEDIIRALGMTFDEGCEFKAIWRTAAARMGNGKAGQKAMYDAEKRVHYAQASLRQYQQEAAQPVTDDWITHDGLSVPVGPEVYVDAVTRGGKTYLMQQLSEQMWRHLFVDMDVVKYRISTGTPVKDDV
ncbi:MAG: hypothetical protein WC117_00135 [Sphaerochaetaceae bacterium]